MISQVFDGFQQLAPDQAAAVQTALTQVAVQVEDQYKGADSKTKEQEALRLSYQALKILIAVPGPIDWAVENFVIPNLPEFFKWIVEQLHHAGVFTRSDPADPQASAGPS